VIDAHVHLWDTGRHSYPWLAEAVTLPDRALLDDYREATLDSRPDGFVFVQAGAADDDGAAEARWVHDQCANQADFAGMVVWAPIEDGPSAVAAHLGTLPMRRVRGVRRMLQGERPGLAAQSGFVEAVAALAAEDLAFDLCLHPHQQVEAVGLARGAPHTRLVLDHLAKPDIAGHGFDEWQTGFRALAACDNVWCKLSGLVTEADPERWSRADLAPFVAEALEAFGPQRLLWGSDWPVCTLAATHHRWWAATAELLADLSGAERHAILHGTAVEVYRLEGF